MNRFQDREAMDMEHLTHSAAETEALGCRLGCALTPGTVVAYRGGLGMGKTAFTRGLAVGWIAGTVSPAPPSPSSTSIRGASPLFHFDMYRLPDADALFDIGWEDYLDRGGECAVEWRRTWPRLPGETPWGGPPPAGGRGQRTASSP